MSSKKTQQSAKKKTVDRVKYIADGFSEDFDSIVEQFKGMSQSFLDILTIWESNKLDNLFVNRFDQRELYEFLEEIYSILTKGLSVLNNDGSRKLVAIYFLLCLYLKQPDNLRNQIRMTRDNIACIRKLLEDSQTPNLDDLKYTLTKLFSLNAIKFVETGTIYGPSLLTKRNVLQTYKNRHNLEGVPSSELPNVDKKITETMKNYLESEFNPALDQFETLYPSYVQVKSRLGIKTTYNLNDHFIPESINQFSTATDNHNNASAEDRNINKDLDEATGEVEICVLQSSDDQGGHQTADDDMAAVVQRLKRLFLHFL